MKKDNVKEGGKGYRLLEHLGTEPIVIYLKKVDADAKDEVASHA